MHDLRYMYSDCLGRCSIKHPTKPILAAAFLQALRSLGVSECPYTSEVLAFGHPYKAQLSRTLSFNLAITFNQTCCDISTSVNCSRGHKLDRENRDQLEVPT